MTEAYASSRLASWVQKLDREPLPVLPQSATQLNKLLRDAEVSVADIAGLIQCDPVMQVHLIRECNRHYSAKAAGKLTQTQHCAAMLGLNKLAPLLKSFKTTQGVLSEPQAAAYFEAINQSLHSAAQAAGWTQFRNPSQRNEMYLSALLYGVPNWCLWRFALPEMQAINELIRQDNVPEAEAEYAVLGCTREEIAQALAQRWYFPESICTALSSKKLPTPAFLIRCTREFERDANHHMPNKTPEGMLVNTPALAINLSSLLAYETSRDWYSPQTQRCLRIAAAYLDQPFHKVWKATVNTALNFSRSGSLPQAQAPACGLLWPPQRRRRRQVPGDKIEATVVQLMRPQAKDRMTAKPTPPSDPGPRSPAAQKPEIQAAKKRNPAFKSRENQTAFEQFFKHLAASNPKTAQQSCIEIIDQLFQHSLLQRIALLPLNSEHNRVSLSYSRGCERSPTMRKLTIPLYPANLISHLLKKPASCWISPERSKEQAGLVPGALKQANQCTDYFLMSLAGNEGVYGLLYADRDEHSLNEADYQLFKLCGSAMSRQLARQR